MASASRLVELSKEIIETIEVFDLCGVNKVTGLTQAGGDFTNILWLKNGALETKTVAITEVTGAPGNYNVKVTPSGNIGDVFYLTYFIPSVEEWHSYIFYTTEVSTDLSAILAELYKMQSKNGGGYDRTTDSLEAIRDLLDQIKLTLDADLGLKVDASHKLEMLSDEDLLKMEVTGCEEVIKLTVIEEED
ncbi:MAG: hypothetical protein DRR06_20330 [Gammaproteobacteria bacterium]|nr:MAG: hypothetical protein DRR06_20330 [Gammaproteobacteria bacterium]